MKRLIAILALLLLFITALVACTPEDDGDVTDTVRVMVTENDGITIQSENPIDIAIGETAEFAVKINTGYIFESVSIGEYDENTGKLTIPEVTRRTRVKFEMENLGYDTSKTYAYSFHDVSGRDTSSQRSSKSVLAGTRITVQARDMSKKFVGWSFGASYEDGGDIVSTDRTFVFRLSPDIVTAGKLDVYPNYTDSNIYYYDTNGGSIKLISRNMSKNDYYTAEVEGNRVKVTMLEKYYSYAECASTFWDDGTFYRTGYVLKEYNTKPDGTGEPYSLGSKFYTESEASSGVLYCIWEKETSPLDFDYESYTMEKPASAKYAPDWQESGVVIRDYLGEEDKVVIPERINGKPVIAISAGAFIDKTVKELVLPKTIQRIADSAFIGCSSLETVYFPNSIYELSDNIFDSATYENFTRLIVNATQAPRNTTTTDGGFAVKLCKLLRSEDEKKIIVISGSSSYQGLGTAYMEALFEGEYSVINFGTTRPRPGLFYLEALSHYTDEDDIFVYAPENSAFMMGEKKLTWRFLYDLEGMNNLFRYVDISNYKNYFSSFATLNQEAVTAKPELRYEQICENGYTSGGARVWTDANGDYQHPNRQYYVGKAGYVDTYFITYNERYKSINDFNWNDKENQEANKDYTDLTNPTWTSIDRPELVAQMNMAIGKAKASGAKVYFGFAPADADKLVDEAKNAEWLARYDALIDRLYDFDGSLGSCADYIFNHEYAYDCAFHVNDYGRTYRTYLLYTHICDKLGITDINGIYGVGTDFDGCLFEDGSDGTPRYKVSYLMN